jgi:hypothetical protein
MPFGGAIGAIFFVAAAAASRIVVKILALRGFI